MPSPLQKYRMAYQVRLPKALENIASLVIEKQVDEVLNADLKLLFPKTHRQPALAFKLGQGAPAQPLKLGVVLSGGQAPGGHNVITGIFDALQKLHTGSRVIGFCDGPAGIINGKYIEITNDLLRTYRNQGGFDIIGSGRTKIETPEQFAQAKQHVQTLKLDGLIIIGGDDSNTNAALLAEYFESESVRTRVIGVPKTIDGDLKNEFIEVSFGFDTACKVYSEIVGNIARDAFSAKKYYYFIKMMGRSASHIALECAMQTHPNMALISEEIEQKQMTLLQVAKEIANMVKTRAEQGKEYGVILIPEGIIEFIPECKALIEELNALLSPDREHISILDKMSNKEEKARYIEGFLSGRSKACFVSIPDEIQAQLLIDRDPHGNVQVSKIETERLFIEMVKKELTERKKAGSYQGKFSGQPHFCGYEGRSAMPSNFDSHYCYALGHVAALLVAAGATGYMSCVTNLKAPVAEWQIAGIPLISMMNLEMRHGKNKPVIKKALVELEGKAFHKFSDLRKQWLLDDDYCSPGPIQYFGPEELTDCVPLTL